MLSNDIAISVRNLTKTYRLFGHPGDRIKQFFSLGLKQYHREFTALKDVSFDIKKGETVGIIGRNGSGKSTLLQLICGILKPTSGTVQVNGRVSALLELGAGFNQEFTGRENVFFQGALQGFTKEQMGERFNAIAAFADIGEFIDQPVRTYSSGMFVRLAFATMAHVDADILVVDEALSVGDAVFVQKCMRHLAAFRKYGSLIIVSHDLASVMALCDRVFWIEGALREHGSARTVCDNYLTASMGYRTNTDTPFTSAPAEEDLADQRQELFHCSNLRNDIELFRFESKAESSGSGLATIIDAWLQNPSGVRYGHVVGGEVITLVVEVRTHAPLASPIVGFIVRDRFGQALIGDNTYLSYATNPVAASADALIRASFAFRMPRLPIGEYSICVTVAEGVPGVHQTHHRINEAITFCTQSSSVTQVLVGLPMLKIDLAIVP
jgi:lipopolysaccharide transport system ATP-binding protein